MIGEIIHFDDAEQQGTIRDEKGGEHAFDLVGWRGRGLPGPGLAVDFELRDGRAVQVFNARIKQQKARRVVSMPPESEAGEAPGPTDDAARPATRKRWWLAGLAIVVLVLAGLWI
ncbi:MULTISPECIES: hypothetical protein [Cobetia]|uniref:hypothetical protein n=1 Tax=Cobetia TaxID=204286 RepID=UPI00178CF1F0|nr:MULTISPECIES: hypothetical protein [Cobetia]MBE2168364.1 hypothetical protein [Cobetia sp. 2AS1]MBU3006498.1 hypothetical protein [Cobetia amphilecti]MDH2294911.1 hypothetical protein [Cobetia sp. 1AS1]MDH2420865.1 hypothetical protein [Cobetia litoralis]MDH2445743.1 hypothetical protein [Cobetia sp. 2AS]